MKITIDTDILNKENISLGEFLVLLMAFYGINYKEINEEVVSKGLISNNLFKDGSSAMTVEAGVVNSKVAKRFEDLYKALEEQLNNYR